MAHFLENKTVLITGASSGIGAACAQLFAREGARVALAARREDRLKALADEIKTVGGSCIYKTTDVSRRDDVEALINYVMQEFGQIDVLVNNAGVGCVGHMAHIDIERVRQVFDINFFGALHCIQLAVPQMNKKGGGHIINVSSVIGKRSVPDIGAYCATKFALNAVSDALRVELNGKGIAVTTICPGLTETEFAENQLRPRNTRPFRTKFSGQSAEHVAKAILKATRTKPREVYLSLGGNFLVYLERLSPWFLDQVLRMRGLLTGYF